MPEDEGMRLGVTLYIQNTLEAVDFYREAFGLTLGYFEKYPNGAYLHASLEKDGQEIISEVNQATSRL